MSLKSRKIFYFLKAVQEIVSYFTWWLSGWLIMLPFGSCLLFWGAKSQFAGKPSRFDSWCYWNIFTLWTEGMWLNYSGGRVADFKMSVCFFRCAWALIFFWVPYSHWRKIITVQSSTNLFKIHKTLEMYNYWLLLVTDWAPPTSRLSSAYSCTAADTHLLSLNPKL